MRDFWFEKKYEPVTSNVLWSQNHYYRKFRMFSKLFLTESTGGAERQKSRPITIFLFDRETLNATLNHTFSNV